MHLTDVIAEFYASNVDDVKSMSKVLYATTPISSNADVLQALVVGVEMEYLEKEFKKEEIVSAYNDLGMILLDMYNKLGSHCLMICDKDDAPVTGYFICEVKYVRSSMAVVSIGVFEENDNRRYNERIV